jgi:hypothetical protein
MIINSIYEHQNLLSLQLFSFLVGLRTYQHPYIIYGFVWTPSFVSYCEGRIIVDCICNDTKVSSLVHG